MRQALMIAAAAGLALAMPAGAAQAQGPGRGLVAANCKAEIATFCSSLRHGSAQIPACLNKNRAELSAQCRSALDRRGPGQGRRST